MTATASSKSRAKLRSEGDELKMHRQWLSNTSPGYSKAFNIGELDQPLCPMQMLRDEQLALLLQTQQEEQPNNVDMDPSTSCTEPSPTTNTRCSTRCWIIFLRRIHLQVKIGGWC